MKDPAKCRAVFYAYTSRYGAKTDIERARCWNAGPNWRNRMAQTEKYVRKVTRAKEIEMGAEAICDGCGKRELMRAGADGNWHKPSDWYMRSDKDGIQLACSRACIEKVATKSGKTATVLPM